jgi:hypothetical protein
MRRKSTRVAVLAVVVGAALRCGAQTSAELNRYFQESVGLKQDQITAIRGGQAISLKMPSRIPDEVFVFGAVFVKATPDSYSKLAYDFDRMRKTPGFLAVGQFSDPPRVSDLKGFSFEPDDIKALKDCKPANCEIQLPVGGIETYHKSVNFSAPDAADQVDRYFHDAVIDRLLAYLKGGNQALGEYNDKKNPTEVPEQFKYMLSYAKALPAALPDYYNYLLDFPKGKPANVEDMFYWAKVKFGLKPTLRVLQVVTMKGSNPHQPAYTIAEKQLYSSHYFETALDMTYCVRGDDPKQPGFYLIMVMGSEQAGLTGFKGSILRKVAVDKSASSLQKSLVAIKNTLEKQ